MHKLEAKLFYGLVILAMMATTLRAQDATENEGQLLPERSGTAQMNKSEEFSESHVGFSLLKNIASDQKTIWTSPFHLRWQDANWLVPFAVTSGLSVATDRSFVHTLSSDPQKLSRFRSVSNDGVAALLGAGAGSYVWSYISHSEHQREMGILTGEAVLDSLLTAQALKYSFGRQRPAADQGRLDFFRGGNSFPSDHAAAAWSVATVIAHEYPGFMTQTLAYSLATVVSASAVIGKDHSPSDVLVGSALGWLIGRQVYRKHHDPDLGGSAVGALPGTADDEPERDPRKAGSPFVPLDSWVYPAFERLAALGYVHTDLMGLRPWTRLECARLLDEAGDLIQQQDVERAEPARLYRALRTEFAQDLEVLGGERNRTLNVDSIYTRVMEISGTPLRDSYHFGETIINDFGRPYADGTNVVSGLSGWASSGRFALYVRGEYQHAPSAPAYSQDVRGLIAHVDRNPVQPAAPFSNVNQFDFLDAYAAMNLDNWQLSFGKQSLWWGPGQSGPLIWSDNIDPVLMARATRTMPDKLPGFLGYLGPMRVDLFFGKLAGHQFPANPVIHGEKISFKPRPRVEIGFSRTDVLGGVGHPLTLYNLLDSYVNIQLNPTVKTPARDPGDRHASLDFSVRTTNWLTVYANLYWDDAIRRTAFNPGIYLPKIPRFSKLDLRAEIVSTDVPPDAGLPRNGSWIYFEGEYHDSYTNRQELIGNWVGRQGRGGQVWGTYWLSPRSSIQVGYRHGWINPQFIPQGGTLADASFRADFLIGSSLSISASTQYENWSVPVLAASSQTEVATSLQLTFYPKWSNKNGR